MGQRVNFILLYFEKVDMCFVVWALVQNDLNVPSLK